MLSTSVSTSRWLRSATRLLRDILQRPNMTPPVFSAALTVDASSVRVRYRIENPANRPLYVQNVFYDKLPSNPLIELRPVLRSTTQMAYSWQCGARSLFLYQGHMGNYTPIPVYAIPAPFFSRVEPGSSAEVEIVLPRPLIEWDWCAPMCWPGGLTGHAMVTKLRLRVDTILEPEIVRELDGFPGVFPTAEDHVSDDPTVMPPVRTNRFPLRADLILPEPLELRTYPRGGFIPIDEPLCE